MKPKKILLSTMIIFIIPSLIFSAGCMLFDKEKPVITITSHNSGDEININSLFLLTGTAYDNFGLKSVQYRIDSEDFADVEGLENWNIIISFSTPGTHFITIKADDYNDNVSYAYLELVTIE